MLYDWNYWCKTYITGTMTLKELSEITGAPALATLRRRSQTEDWPKQRQTYQSTQPVEVDLLAAVAAAERIVDAAEMLTKHIQLARLLRTKAADAVAATDPITLRPNEALAWAKAAIEIERLTEGMVTKRQQIDLTNLSDAELERLLED